jgi:uncharacterized protein YdhG (YjbR/CyaY superfamily)
MATATSVDEYLAAQPAARRDVLAALRETIHAAAPDATESIAYGMPAFRLDGRFLVSYAAFARHYSLFPASGAVIDALGDAVTPYLAGKATLQFPADRSIPLPLVARVVTVRLAELGARRRR